MKRLMIYLALMVITVFLASATALMRESLRPQLGNFKDLPQRSASREILPPSYFNQNRTHKIILSNRDSALYNELARVKAIRKEINYDAFKLLVIDEEAAGGRETMRALQVPVRDEQNLIALNGYMLDTSNPQPLSVQLPSELRQTRMAEASSSGLAPEPGLFIVQFAGPVKDEWFDMLKSTGARIISYVPNNAYIVSTDRKSAFAVWQMKEQNPVVQYLGDYEGAYRLSPSLQAVRASGSQPFVKVTVQVIDSPEGELVAENLKRYSQQFFGESRVMNYHNVTVTIPVSQLAELANNDSVFGIEAGTERKRMDEAQGQIVAGNLSGGSPRGPGYLNWLASKGFNASQFTSFSINVVDDTYTLTGHPDLPSTRIAFQNNPTNQTGTLTGHGFLNAHIVGGFNIGSGSAFEDSRGFNYDLGIVPWARVGVTAIFGTANVGPDAWENTAYGQGARVSSNSWGLMTIDGGPVPLYDSTAQLFDQIVRDARPGTGGLQQLIVVFAAGNFGAANTVSSPSTAKNVITVGASENVRQAGTDGCGQADSGADNANDMATFSSRGPVNSGGGDGRVKPDIVAPGTHVTGGVPQSNYDGSRICNPFFPAGQTLYGLSTGTSHAAPAVSGAAALVYRDFINKGMPAPSPAMVKAVLMNSAAYLSGTGAGGNLPSNSQGMGRLDLSRALSGVPRTVLDQTRILSATGQTYEMIGTITTATQPLRITLAWTDAPGPITGAPWVNNLDLEVEINGQNYRGNVFSGPNSTTGGSADTRNNVESVFLPAGIVGNFTVRVRATNIAGDGVPGNGDSTDQDFALIVSNGEAIGSSWWWPRR